MSEFLKSAFDYFGSGTKSKGNNELVGNCIEIGNQNFKVLHTIAEGGFSVVFEAQDVKTNKLYALKRLISHDADTNKEIMQEIGFLKKLNGHANIIKFFTAASIGQERQRHMGTDFLIVTELCTGQVIQLMHRRNKVFPYSVTLQIFNHVTEAVEHMHKQSPPIIHRDLKVENLLISCHGVIKLCDFGSATTVVHFPDNSWTGLKRSEVQEEIEKHTTPMYRTPEMLDLYQNYPINEACDIWALGCILYYLCFNKHPFEDSAKLAILNANYSIPPNTDVNDSCCGLIYQMLLIDPRQRPKISEIINEIKFQASAASVVLNASVTFDKESLSHLPPLRRLPDTKEVTVQKSDIVNKPLPPRPQPPAAAVSAVSSLRAQKIHPVSSSSSRLSDSTLTDISQNLSTPKLAASQSSIVSNNTVAVSSSSSTTAVNSSSDGKKMFGIIKGAENIMKNIRDASNKVIEQVSSTLNKTDLDLTYITSRIIMMPTPGEAGIDVLTRDKIDDIQTFLEFRHPNQYYVYNLSLRSIKSEKFRDRVMQMGIDPMKSMHLNNLVKLCFHQHQWLSADPKNVIVVQCSDGRIVSGMNVAALLCFCRLVDTSSAAINIVRFRRGDCQFTPSQLRFIDYICRLMHKVEEAPNAGLDVPHNYFVKLTGIDLEPVPIFNRARTGIRPYVEIFNDYKLVYSNIKNYEDLYVFTFDHKNAKISIPNISVQGDLNIVIYHTRSNIVSKGKVSSIKICEASIYTGYLDPNFTEVVLTQNQLDNLDGDLEKYPVGFCVKIHLFVTKKMANVTSESPPPMWNSDKFRTEIIDKMPRKDRLLPFANRDEMRTCMTAADVKLPVRETRSAPTVKSPHENGNTFLNSLDWNATDMRRNFDNTKMNRPLSFASDSAEFPNLSTNVSNDYESIIEPVEDKPSSEAVGNLLGDFNVTLDDNVVACSQSTNEKLFHDNVQDQENSDVDDENHNRRVQMTTNDVDGLVDFFSTPALSCTNSASGIRSEVMASDSNFSVINNDIDFFNTPPPPKSHGTNSGGTSSTNDIVNLLFFDSSSSPPITNQTATIDNEKLSSSNKFIFDPFGHNLVNSNSTIDVTSSNEWMMNTSAIFPQPSSTQSASLSGTTVLRSSNSTNSLLNLTSNSKQSHHSGLGAPLATPLVAMTSTTTSTINSSSSSFHMMNSKATADFFNFETKPTNPSLLINNSKPVPGPKPTKATTTTASGTNSGTSINNTNDKKKGFGQQSENVAAPKTKPQDAFKDLLGDFRPNEFSSSSASNGSKSIKDIRKEKLSKTTDPETMKILEWVDGREKNIRALLCSLATVLWDEVRWPGVSMAELVTVDQVKRAYRNAIRCVHPDKWNNTKHEHFSKMIMIELNDAMSEFEAEKNAASSN